MSCYQKFPLVTASVKGERGGQGHTSASLLHWSATWYCAVNTHCFYTSAFSTSYFVLSVMDGKIEQCVCIKFCVKLSKSASWGFLSTFFKQDSGFEWHSCFKVGQVSVEDEERSGRPSNTRWQKMLKKIKNSSMKTVAKQYTSLQTPLG
jgi:hypothetical protein